MTSQIDYLTSQFVYILHRNSIEINKLRPTMFHGRIKMIYVDLLAWYIACIINGLDPVCYQTTCANTLMFQIYALELQAVDLNISY